MSLDAWGPLTAFLIVACLLLARRSWLAGRHNAVLFFILVAGTAFRIYLGTDRFLHAWDERFHALVAKNLLAHPFLPTLYESPVFPYDYRDWGANHVWLHKPPMAMWLAAGSMAIFGVHELSFRLPSLITSVISIVFTYQIALRLFSERTAALAALFHAGSGLLILMAAGVVTSDVVDNLLVVLTEAAILLAVMWTQQPSRVRAMLVGVLVGAALLTKSWPALVAIPVQLSLGHRTIGRRVVLIDVATTVAVAAAVAAPWILYTQAAFPAEAVHERAAALRHLTESVEGQATSLSYLLTRIPRVFGELVFVPLAWFLWRAVVGRPSPGWIATAMWVAIPLVTFSLAVSKSISYLAISAPAFFIVQAEFVGRVSDSRWRGALGEFCRRTVIVLLLLLPLRFAFERLNPLHGRQRTKEWAETLRALRPVLNKSVVLFGTDHPVEAMFITDATAYSFVPSIEQVTAVQERGRAVAICHDRPLPTELEAAVDIHKVLCRDRSATEASELRDGGRPLSDPGPAGTPGSETR